MELTDVEIGSLVMRKLTGESWKRIAKTEGIPYQSMRRHVRNRLDLFKKKGRQQ